MLAIVTKIAGTLNWNSNTNTPSKVFFYRIVFYIHDIIIINDL